MTNSHCDAISCYGELVMAPSIWYSFELSSLVCSLLAGNVAKLTMKMFDVNYSAATVII